MTLHWIWHDDNKAHDDHDVFDEHGLARMGLWCHEYSWSQYTFTSGRILRRPPATKEGDFVTVLNASFDTVALDMESVRSAVLGGGAPWSGVDIQIVDEEADEAADL